MYTALCTLNYVLWNMYCELCTVNYVLWTTYTEIFTLNYVHWTMYTELCSINYVNYTYTELCTLKLCPLYTKICTLNFVHWTMIHWTICALNYVHCTVLLCTPLIILAIPDRSPIHPAELRSIGLESECESKPSCAAASNPLTATPFIPDPIRGFATVDHVIF